jgi:hypothetical protein
VPFFENVRNALAIEPSDDRPEMLFLTGEINVIYADVFVLGVCQDSQTSTQHWLNAEIVTDTHDLLGKIQQPG